MEGPRFVRGPLVYSADMVGDLAAFESTVLDQAPPGAVVVGASLSPDGRYGAALTFLPCANYLMDDVLYREAIAGWGTPAVAAGESRGAFLVEEIVEFCGTGGKLRRTRPARGSDTRGGVQGAGSIRSLLVRGIGRRLSRRSSSSFVSSRETTLAPRASHASASRPDADRQPLPEVTNAKASRNLSISADKVPRRPG